MKLKYRSLQAVYAQMTDEDVNAYYAQIKVDDNKGQSVVVKPSGLSILAAAKIAKDINKFMDEVNSLISATGTKRGRAIRKLYPKLGDADLKGLVENWDLIKLITASTEKEDWVNAYGDIKSCMQGHGGAMHTAMYEMKQSDCFIVYIYGFARSIIMVHEDGAMFAKQCYGEKHFLLYTLMKILGVNLPQRESAWRDGHERLYIDYMQTNVKHEELEFSEFHQYRISKSFFEEYKQSVYKQEVKELVLTKIGKSKWLNKLNKDIHSVILVVYPTWYSVPYSKVKAIDGGELIMDDTKNFESRMIVIVKHKVKRSWTEKVTNTQFIYVDGY